MRGHLKRIAMCAPMLIISAVLLATGTSVAVLVPVAACVLMMGAMMPGMGMLGSNRHDGH